MEFEIRVILQWTDNGEERKYTEGSLDEAQKTNKRKITYCQFQNFIIFQHGMEYSKYMVFEDTQMAVIISV